MTSPMCSRRVMCAGFGFASCSGEQHKAHEQCQSVKALCQVVVSPCTHVCPDNPAFALQAAGIPESLVRLSIGIEDTDDLLQDIQQALSAIS